MIHAVRNNADKMLVLQRTCVAPPKHKRTYTDDAFSESSDESSTSMSSTSSTSLNNPLVTPAINLPTLNTHNFEAVFSNIVDYDHGETCLILIIIKIIVVFYYIAKKHTNNSVGFDLVT